MTRRNLGVQIALILFILLSIGLGVGVYMNYQKWDETRLAIEKSLKSETDKQAEIDAVSVDVEVLKKLIGCPADMRLPYVQDLFNKDIDKYAGPQSGLNVEDADKVYAKMVGILYNQIQEQKATLAQRQAELEQLKIINLSRENKNDQKLLSIISAVQKDQQTLQTAYTNANTQRWEINNAKVALYEQIDKVFRDNEQSSVDLYNKLGSANDRINDLTQVGTELTQIVSKQQGKSLSKPDGTVLSFNPASGVAIISLGSSSNIRNQMAFDVYPANATSSTTKPKGSVIVQRILSSSQSECLATELSATDPIVSGDKIFTQDWRPGDHTRYALCGLIDTNGSGQDRLTQVLGYIHQHGDKYDAYLKGTTVYGKIAVETQYIVLGKRPDDAKDAAGAKAYDNFVKEAHRLNIPDMTVAELMRRLEVKDRPGAVSSTVRRTTTPGAGVSQGSDNRFRSRSGSRVMPR